MRTEAQHETRIVNTLASERHGVTTHMLAIETNGLKSHQDEIRTRLLGQQSIYDKTSQTIGQELTLRVKLAFTASRTNLPKLRNAEDETLLAGLYSMAEDGSLNGKSLLVSVSAATLMSPEIEYLSQHNVMYAVQAGVQDVATLLPRMTKLVASGYRIVLDDVAHDDAMRPLLALASQVRVDVSHHDAIHLENTVRSLRTLGAKHIIAMNVAEEDTFNACLKLGFDAFQGNYFSQPKGAHASAPAVNRLRVLELMDRVIAHADMSEIEALLKMDAALSYRLLRFTNSAGSGVTQPVGSMAQVLHSMGHAMLYRWLTLLLHASDATGNHNVLLKRALTRACFMQALAGKSLQATQADELYQVGLFSVMKDMLGTDAASAFSRLDLNESVKQALVHGVGNHAGFLELALACEADDEARMQQASAQCLVTYIDVNIAMINALIIAEEAAL
jgi:EAL and modified HD-GYP domain-containing signal transduction protein